MDLSGLPTGLCSGFQPNVLNISGLKSSVTGDRLIFNRGAKDSKIRVKVFINYGYGRIKKTEASIRPGTSILEILKMVSDIQYTPDESATGHMGSMITSIDGFKNDLSHFWLFFLREDDDCGWMLPMKMPNEVSVSKNSTVACRYHEMEEGGLKGSGNQIFGPLYSKECISKIKRCNRQF